MTSRRASTGVEFSGDCAIRAFIDAVADESRRQFALFVTKPARVESYPTRAPLLSYFLSQILQGGKTGGATRDIMLLHETRVNA